MGLGGADDPASTTWRAAAGRQHARGYQRPSLLLWTGCQWQALPKDLPPKSTVHHYFKLWDWDGTLERIHHALYIAVREQAGREASPSAAIIDSQSAKTAQKGGPRWTRKVTMRARRSPAASGTSSSIRSVFC
jgi:transposase